jgi:hypothetical protein
VNNVSINEAPLPTTTTANVNYSGSVDHRQAPTVFVGGPASGSCTGASGSFGISTLGGGIGGSGASVDPSCTLRENLRVLTMTLPALEGESATFAKGLIMEMLQALKAHLPKPPTN